uniref:DNA polymerase III subunit epsilon n=1 Tax=mine drainage metagenome TaxID=410659 RepID=E6QS09_9ZZZZ
MSRQIFLDTETTGLEPRLGHRIIEIAGVEMLNRRLTGRHFHRYLNPDRDIDAGAEAVHGLSRAFLQDKPRFGDVAQAFLDYLGDAELVIHNAPFDIGFLNAELSLLNQAPLTGRNVVLDTLKMARDLHPGQKNNLDALCRRYEIDNTRRTLHGALLDAELLASVYLAMTRGQDSLMTGMDLPQQQSADKPAPPVFGDIKVLYASEDELSMHSAALAAIQKDGKEGCVWLMQGEAVDMP